MREECERDHRGGEVELVLEGSAYHLFLRGHRWSGARWVGSEYYERNPVHYWFEGIGEIMEKATGKKMTFAFKTWENERGRERSLRNFVLISDRWDYGYNNELKIAVERLPDLVDFVCAPLFAKVAAEESSIPSFHFGQLSDKTLVAAGLVSDRTGQIHLPNVVPA